MDGQRCYYLFGATDPELRKSESGTKNLIDAFARVFADQGLCEADLLGVNSPQRGGFKLSFGARLQPYFAVAKVGPSGK
jgi:hypothetical protein